MCGIASTGSRQRGTFSGRDDRSPIRATRSLGLDWVAAEEGRTHAAVTGDTATGAWAFGLVPSRWDPARPPAASGQNELGLLPVQRNRSAF